MHSSLQGGRELATTGHEHGKWGTQAECGHETYSCAAGAGSLNNLVHTCRAGGTVKQRSRRNRAKGGLGPHLSRVALADCCPKRRRAHVLNCFSRVWLFAPPWIVAHQAPLSVEFSRQECWSGLPALPPPGDLPHPGIKLTCLKSPALEGGFSISSTTWEAQAPL